MNLSPSPERRPRRRKLVEPRLQLVLGSWFVGVVALALSLQFLFLARSLTRIATELPGDPALYYDSFVGEALRVTGISLLVIVPLTLAVGIHATFRLVGPVHRIKAFLRAVRDGESPADLRLRRGDAMEDLAQLANEATAPLRACRGPSEAGGDEGEQRAA